MSYMPKIQSCGFRASHVVNYFLASTSWVHWAVQFDSVGAKLNTVKKDANLLMLIGGLNLSSLHFYERIQKEHGFSSCLVWEKNKKLTPSTMTRQVINQRVCWSFDCQKYVCGFLCTYSYQNDNQGITLSTVIILSNINSVLNAGWQCLGLASLQPHVHSDWQLNRAVLIHHHHHSGRKMSTWGGDEMKSEQTSQELFDVSIQDSTYCQKLSF